MEALNSQRTCNESLEIAVISLMHVAKTDKKAYFYNINKTTAVLNIIESFTM